MVVDVTTKSASVRASTVDHGRITMCSKPFCGECASECALYQ